MSDPHPAAPLLGWMRPTHWRLIDALSGAGYGVLAFVVLVDGASSTGGWLAAFVGAVCLAVPVAARRRAPVMSLVVLLATLVVLAVISPSGAVMALPPVVLALYTVAAETRLPSASVGLRGGLRRRAPPACTTCSIPGGSLSPFPCS